MQVKYKLEVCTYDTFIPGRGANVIIDDVVVGYFGEVSPQVIVDFEITHPVIFFEMNLQEIIDKAQGSIF